MYIYIERERYNVHVYTCRGPTRAPARGGASRRAPPGPWAAPLALRQLTIQIITIMILAVVTITVIVIIVIIIMALLV